MPAAETISASIMLTDYGPANDFVRGAISLLTYVAQPIQTVTTPAHLDSDRGHLYIIAILFVGVIALIVVLKWARATNIRSDLADIRSRFAQMNADVAGIDTEPFVYESWGRTRKLIEVRYTAKVVDSAGKRWFFRLRAPCDGFETRGSWQISEAHRVDEQGSESIVVGESQTHSPLAHPSFHTGERPRNVSVIFREPRKPRKKKPLNPIARIRRSGRQV